MKIYIANDHAAIDLKRAIITKFSDQHEIINLGTDEPNSVDYPDYANKLATSLKNNPNSYGILLCGSGIGISIAANRHKHIRAALCHNAETAKLARQHNDANVLVLGARIIEQDIALETIEAFLSTSFDGGRHKIRVEKL